MTFQHCMNEMTRPQLMIWFETTLNRQEAEQKAKQKAEWSRTANLLAMLWNTQMGIKKKDMKKAKEFMPEFEKHEKSNETLVKKTEEAGLTPPSNY